MYPISTTQLFIPGNLYIEAFHRSSFASVIIESLKTIVLGNFFLCKRCQIKIKNRFISSFTVFDFNKKIKICPKFRWILVAGWWGHQPGQHAVGGVPTAHKQHGNATIWNAPAASLDEFIQLNFYNFIRNREDDSEPVQWRQKEMISISHCY